MRIAYVDGRRLRRGLIAGAKRLAESAGLLDRINVFPVPDGDTGANMAATVLALSSGVAEGATPSVGRTARMAADAALNGARGNSGAILAQFFHGLADNLAHEARIGTRRFAEGVKAAAHAARMAISSPKEGTIITVLHDWAEAAHRVAARTDDFMDLIKDTLAEARRSLKRTIDLLPELKKAGVVDAGALGFVRFVEGVYNYMLSGRMRDADGRGLVFADDAAEFSEYGDNAGFEDIHDEAPDRRYCLEAMLDGDALDSQAVRAGLQSLGNSVVVAGSTRRLKIHAHTDQPQRVFRFLEGAGRVDQPKVDDMVLQAARSQAGHRACAVLSDSAADLPESDRLALGIELVPLQLTLDGKTRLDGVGMSAQEVAAYLKDARPGQDFPTTSQPSPAAFARKLDLALSKADECVYIGVSGALSGTLEAGKRAALTYRDPGRARALDSRQISVGQGLIVRAAARAAAGGASADAVESAARAAAARVRLLVSAPSLEGLVRSGRLKGMKAVAARALGIRPVITLDDQGKAGQAGLYFGTKAGRAAMLRMLSKIARPGTRLEALIAHVDAEDEARLLAAELAAGWVVDPAPEIVWAAPALAAHGGLGALALAVLLPESKA
ncbi:MAG: DegV family EDD domain-containing protein [Spirochaetia bacterium]|nr:DegV family EDD domain-containing protein [Spirochaetia bacterium]